MRWHERFSINLRKNVFHCRGCEKGGDPIELARLAEQLAFFKAVEFLTGRTSRQRREIDPTIIAERERKQRERLAQQTADDAQSTANALRWWGAGQCIYNTPAATYRASRRCDGQFPIDRGRGGLSFHPHRLRRASIAVPSIALAQRRDRANRRRCIGRH